MSRNMFSTLAGAALMLVGLVSGASAQAIDVKLGYSELFRTDQAAEIVVVGNDRIANATIAAEGTIVVTGHALGSTNLILLDEAGAEITSATVRVVPVDPRPQRTVRLIAGGASEGALVYVCGPEPGCAPGVEGIVQAPLAVEAEDDAAAEEAEDEAQPE
jgi:hypothetical protein